MLMWVELLLLMLILHNEDTYDNIRESVIPGLQDAAVSLFGSLINEFFNECSSRATKSEPEKNLFFSQHKDTFAVGAAATVVVKLTP